MQPKYKMEARSGNFFSAWKKVFLLGFLILLVAIFLRLYRLTSLPVFADEAIYIRWSQVMRAEPGLRFLPLSDGKQPLFMWTVIPFLKIFKDPLFAGRFLSVFTGIGTLVGVFTLCFLLFKSKKIGFTAALIYAISPYTVFFDRMALTDSMLAMFGVWVFVFAVLTVKYVRLDMAILAGFALGGSLLTKSPAVFFAILLPIVLILSSWPKKRKDKLLHLVKLVLLLIVTYLLSFLIYNILRLGPNFHMIGIRNKDYVFSISHLWTSPQDPFLSYLKRGISWIWTLGPNMLLIFAILGFVVNFKKYKKPIIFLVVLSVVPFLVQAEFAKVFTTRYILFTIPPLIILASSAFLAEGKVLQKILTIGLVLLVLQAVNINRLILTNTGKAPLPRVMRSGYLEEWTAGHGIREVAEYLKAQAEEIPDGSQIVVGTEGYFGTLPDGLQIYLNDEPKIMVIGVGLGIKELPTPLAESREFGNKTYLVINSTRLEANPDDLDLTLLAVYPKEAKPDGSREALFLFEVSPE